MHPVRFLPAYVGSKAHWVRKLERYRGRDFVEFFAGSGVISANLASRAVLNDADPFLHRYFREYESQPVVQMFTDEDYFTRRFQDDWYRWLYYLQKMSFSGLYRHNTKGLYNAPIRENYKSSAVYLKDALEQSIERFKALSPSLHNLDYSDVPIPERPDVAVFDPPYESKQAPYNARPFDYGRYWKFVRTCIDTFRVVIVFDWDKNMDEHLPGHSYKTRKMRVNGKHDGALEAMCVIDNDDPTTWPVRVGEIR